MMNRTIEFFATTEIIFRVILEDKSSKNVIIITRKKHGKYAVNFSIFDKEKNGRLNIVEHYNLFFDNFYGLYQWLK